MADSTRRGHRLAGVILFCLLGVMTVWQLGRADLPVRLALNRQGLMLLKHGGQDELEAGLTDLSSRDCHAAWLLGAASRELEHTTVRDAAWKEALRCSEAYLPLVEILAPEREDLAALAVETYPQEAEGWFWLARITAAIDPEKAARYTWQGLEVSPYDSMGWRMLSDALARLDPARALTLYGEFGLNDIGDRDPLNRDEGLFVFARILSKEAPEQAIELYRQGLQANPYDGVRWRELGDILRNTDPKAAIEAYLQSCYNGDPGFNGCYWAGRTSEDIEDIQSAITYYRFSAWDVAQKRADELEARLTSP